MTKQNLAIKLPPPMREALENESAATGLSMAEIIRSAIAAYLAQQPSRAVRQRRLEAETPEEQLLPAVRLVDN